MVRGVKLTPSKLIQHLVVSQILELSLSWGRHHTFRIQGLVALNWIKPEESHAHQLASFWKGSKNVTHRLVMTDSCLIGLNVNSTGERSYLHWMPSQPHNISLMRSCAIAHFANVNSACLCGSFFFWELWSNPLICLFCFIEQSLISVACHIFNLFVHDTHECFS